MKATLTLLFCISFGMLIAQSISLNSEITTPGETPYLVGKIDKNRLTGPNYKSWFNSTYNSYQPDNTILASLSPNINQYKIQIFIGTWCVDSRREVTRFIKILENSKFSKNQLEIIALDYKPGRYKKSPGQEEKGLNILRVPTFIIFKNNSEIGRIIERPTETLEKDLLNIILKFQNNTQLFSSKQN